MKTPIAIIFFLLTTLTTLAQITVGGVSPAAIQGNYAFSVQENSGAWPGQTDDATWGVVNAIDFNIPGTHIFDTLKLVEDGTPGVNSEGNPISQQGCNPLTNDLTGKIAVIYYNSCSFVTSLLNAQNAGAVAAIVIGNSNSLIEMPGDAVDGINVTIPAVYISRVDGHLLVTEMNNGPVTMFIGNKMNAFNNDLGSVKGEFLIAPYSANLFDLFNGFELGIAVHNFGVNDQTNATVNATIEDLNGIIYDETISFSILAGETLSLFPGNTLEFPAYDPPASNGFDGDYVLRYTISMDSTDDFPLDNVFEADFNVNDYYFSKARIASYDPISTNYPANATTEYQSCIMVQESVNFGIPLDGMTIVPYTDTSRFFLVGTEILVNVYQWEDNWTDLNDPNYTFDPTLNDAFQDLALVTYGIHYPVSDNEVGQPAFVHFAECVLLQNDVRYLFCAQTYDPNISFGYDNGLDYSANYTHFAQPVSTVNVDGQWYVEGWNRPSAPSIALHIDYCELEERNQLQGNVFPNPANDLVTVSVNATGEASVRIIDVSGKVVYNAPVTLDNGRTTVNVASFQTGMYQIWITTEDSRSAQFNVIKK